MWRIILTKKQWIIRIILAVLVIAAAAAASFSVYKLGYSRGASSATARLSRAKALANETSDTETDMAQPGRKASFPEGQPGQPHEKGDNQGFQPGSKSGKSDSDRPGSNQGQPGRSASAPGQHNPQFGQPGQMMMQNNAFQPQVNQYQPAGLTTYPAPRPGLWIVVGVVLAVFALAGLWLVYRLITLLLNGQGWQFTFNRIEEAKPKK